MQKKVLAWAQVHVHFSKFLLVGSLNTLIDLCLYFVLANLSHVLPVAANLLSTGITMCISFYLNHHFVFKSTKKKQQTMFHFVGATLFNVWGVQSVVIFLVIHVFGQFAWLTNHQWTLNVLAKLAGVSVSFILNYFMYKYIFKGSRSEESVVL